MTSPAMLAQKIIPEAPENPGLRPTITCGALVGPCDSFTTERVPFLIRANFCRSDIFLLTDLTTSIELVYSFTMLLTSALFFITSLTQVISFPSPTPKWLERRTGVTPSLSGPAVDMTSGEGGTYPRINYLSDGSIIGAFTAFIGGDNVLTVTQSTDGGGSWTTIGTAVAAPSNITDLDNPFPFQLPSGRILLACRNHNFINGTLPHVYTQYRIDVFSSDDCGVTWSYLSTPAQQVARTVNNGLWEPFMRVDGNGTLQIFYSQEVAADDQNQMMQTSIDGGATWSKRSLVIGHDVIARDGMIGIATMSGSTLIAVFESVPPNGTFTVNAVTSYDDGYTWTDRRLVYSPTGTDNNAGAPQVVNVGGTLCVSFMTDEDTQEHMWITGAGSKLVTGTDGQNWGNKIEVFEPQANWPGILALDDESMLYVVDATGAKAQKIVLM